MRILQVINNLATGGAEKLLLDSIPKYRKLGIEMDLLLLNGKEYPFVSELRKRCDCKIISLGEGSVYRFKHIFKLKKHLKSYDLVHVHLFPALYWVAFAKKWFHIKTPLIFTEHNTTNRRRDHWFLSRMDRKLYKMYKSIITISAEVDSNLKAHLDLPDSRFEFIQNGIDVEAIREASPIDPSEFSLPDGSKIIIQVSSFTDQKDQATVIRAMQHLDAQVHLVLVGTGPTMEQVQSLTKELQLEARVHFLGVRMDVPDLLKMSDVVILSTHYEGLSLSSIEALASGKPFVATRAPGLSEIVEGAGVLFEIGNDRALAEAVQKLLDSEEYYDTISSKGSKRADEYSMDVMIDKHIALYRKHV